MPFCIDMIERKFNIDREANNKCKVSFSNMERLMIASLILKVKGMTRTYEKSSKGGYREMFRIEKDIEQTIFIKNEEEYLICH